MSTTTKTSVLRPGRFKKHWVLIDADQAIVGRLASIIAKRLRGKHRPDFTPHVDCGDKVVVINADKVVFTGRKRDQKAYFHHTGYPGGLKKRLAKAVLNGPFPERVVEKAVERMLPRGPLYREILKNLYVYSGPHHPHIAQKPEPLSLGDMNKKNIANPVRESFRAGHILSNRAVLDFPEDAKRGLLEPTLPEREDLTRAADKAGDLSAMAAVIEQLLLALDDPDVRGRKAALDELSRILPRLDIRASLRHAALRYALRNVPDRLLKALNENLEEREVARSAAVAITAAVFPQHYVGSEQNNEARVLEDFESIMRKLEIDSFTTMTSRASRGGATLKARLWDGVPFELSGRKPRLAPAEWIEPGGTLSLDVSGAKPFGFQNVSAEELLDGQVAGFFTGLSPQEPIAEKVIVYLKLNDMIFDRYVYDSDQLFSQVT